MFKVNIATLVFAFALCQMSWGQTFSSSHNEIFVEANKAIQNGDLDKAITKYRKLLKSGHNNATLHYNLGISLYKANQLGSSLFHFKMANHLAPRDADIKYNLQYVRNQTTDKIEVKSNVFLTLLLHRFPFSEKESYLLLIMIALMLLLFSSLLIYKKNDWIRWGQRVLLGLFILLATAVFLRHTLTNPFGVVISEKAGVFSATGKDNVLLFSLHEGAEFEIEEWDQKWIRITLADGKKGWTQRSKVIVSEKPL